MGYESVVYRLEAANFLVDLVANAFAVCVDSLPSPTFRSPFLRLLSPPLQTELVLRSLTRSANKFTAIRSGTCFSIFEECCNLRNATLVNSET